MTRALRRTVIAVALVATLVGCAGELTTPGEPLRLLAVTLPSAYEGEAFEAALRPTGGLRPYRYEVVDGSLPPGLTIEGGRLVGVPSEQGRFAFTVEVQDANLNRTVQRLELSVGPLPPPVVTIEVPPTEVQRPTELRLRLASGRGWLGSQVLVEWDPDAFVLDPDSIRTAQRHLLAVWETAPGRLRVDLVTTGQPVSQAMDLVRFSLAPTESAPLGIELEVVSTASAGVTESRTRLGPASGSPPTAPLDASPGELDGEPDGLEFDDDPAVDDDLGDLELDDDLEDDEP